jgi:hypothetical protein
MDSLHQHDDLEAVPQLHEESGCSTVEEPPRRSFFSGRKKMVAGVCSILVVAAITMGVSLSVKSKQRTGFEQSSVAVTGNETPQEQEDIINDKIDELEEPEVEMNELAATEGGITIASENVPVDDEDIEITAFDGPITDFIVTPDISRISKAVNGMCTNSNEGVWYLQLNTDKYPWENSWEFRNAQGTVVMSGPPAGKNYARLTTYIGSTCVEAGDYIIEIFDKSGDGICCEYGTGKMVVKVNGKTVVSTSDSNFKSFKKTIVISPQVVTTPTNTKTPTSKPSNSVAEVDQTGLHSVIVSVETDKFGKETGYTFTSLEDGEVLINKEKGDLEGQTLYESKFLVNDGKGLKKGQYSLTLSDDFQGIANPGFYAVVVDGIEVLFDNKNKTYVINVGIDPPTTARDKEWLNAHNIRRKAFFEAEGVTHKPLVWSPVLAEAASDWVDQITPTCIPILESGNIDGENLSTRTANSERNEDPETLLARWVDKQVGNTYPENQSMTQVLWKATRYVGCKDKMTQQDNQLCYVSVCRYARAGNCQINSENWKEVTLAGRSGCGRACPGDECY